MQRQAPRLLFNAVVLNGGLTVGRCMTVNGEERTTTPVPLTRFSSEYELQRVVSRCHSILWERQGFDPAQAFDEFSKLLYVRYYDEVIGANNTTPGQDESPRDFAQRVDALFTQAKVNPAYAGIFTGQSIVAEPLSVLQVFRELAPFSVVATTAELDGADIKGTVYERIIGTTFRGQLGQFFTHRSIVEFMVRMIGIGEHDMVYDPSCGSGGFLIMCAKVLREELAQRHQCTKQHAFEERLHKYSQRCLYGTEINERTARVARFNLLLHGLAYANIANENALNDNMESARPKRRRFDVVFANPPFAGVEKDPDVLSRYVLGRGSNGTTSAVTREVLFLERIVQVLRDGGKAGIVIPQGIFTNRNLTHVREYLRRNTQILAVIELPDWAFIPSGTNVRGSLLFIQKHTTSPLNYQVFVKKVDKLGFTSTGRSTHENDFPLTVKEFGESDNRYLVPITEMDNRLDAKFYLPTNRETMGLFQHNRKYPLLPLASIGTFVAETVSIRATPNETIMLIETSSVDPAALTITAKHVQCNETKYTNARRVRAGDILISRRRTYRGAVIVVPMELDGALAITEFSVLRLHQGYDTNYVVEILRHPKFLQLMTIYSTGEMSGRINEKDLRNLALPVPKDHASIGADLQRHRERIHEFEENIIQEQHRIHHLCGNIINGCTD